MMKLAKVSEDRLFSTFDNWYVSPDFRGPIYNYLVYGYYPGSFFHSALANDFMGAMLRSHPNNTISALTAMSGWMQNHMPEEAYGSYKKVELWTEIPEYNRRAILERCDLIFGRKEEVWRTLSA